MSIDSRGFDPFKDFINNHLNMDCLVGMNPEIILVALRETLTRLAADPTSTLWAEKLDGLQDMIRYAVDFNMVNRLFDHKADDRDELDTVILLSLTLGFVCYNDLALHYGDLGSNEMALASRMRRLLRQSAGWVKAAAEKGDEVADNLAQEVEDLLDESNHLGW